MLRFEIHLSIMEQKLSPIQALINKYHINPLDIKKSTIVHQSLDARNHRQPCWNFQVDLELNNENKYLKHDVRVITPFKYKLPKPGEKKLASRPIIVGFGPCGMAAGLALAKAGYQPIIIERGPQIDLRKDLVNKYWQEGKLNKEGNVQFGQGGAGAFSDGKLTTRVKDQRVKVILDTLIKYGADQSISYLNHPHVGTDKLCLIVANIQKEIEDLGGTILFESRLDNLIIENNVLKAIQVHGKEDLVCDNLILGIGHSAKDTFRMLASKQVKMIAKPFAVGVRIEHSQDFINQWQYRNITNSQILPPAEYYLSYTSSLGKGVYSFCMCPGGFVVASESETSTIVTNGMSYSARDGKNANSALIVQVNQQDYGEGIFAGIEYQEKLESAAFNLGKGKAPYQSTDSYLNHRVDPYSDLIPTYSLGVTNADLHLLFSDSINHSLEEMLGNTNSLIPGFSGNGSIITGVETRSSSPIRIERDYTTMESNIEGLYPCGEGAGYAGGIVSSAIDGIKCAEKIITKYALPSR